MEAKVVRAAFLVMIIGVVSDAQDGRHLMMTSEYTTYKGTSLNSGYTTYKGTSVTSEENVTVSTIFHTNGTETTVTENNVTLSTVSPPNVTYTTSHSSTTPKPQNNTYPEYAGFICAGIAVVFYGSNFIPVKKFDTGDGMFFQWCLCSGIFLVGIVVQIVRSSAFHPLVMVGGAVWSTANICVVPIIKTIGMGLGLCIWGTFNLLSGWASGRFGWFGIQAEVPSRVDLNYIGVTLSIISSFIYMFVKSEVSAADVEVVVKTGEEGETDPLIQNQRTGLYGTNSQEDILVFNKRRTPDVSIAFLSVPHIRLEMFSHRSLSFSGPSICNDLPPSLRTAELVHAFQSGFKTSLLETPAISHPSSCPFSCHNPISAFLHILILLTGAYLCILCLFVLYCDICITWSLSPLLWSVLMPSDLDLKHLFRKRLL